MFMWRCRWPVQAKTLVAWPLVSDRAVWLCSLGGRLREAQLYLLRGKVTTPLQRYLDCRMAKQGRGTTATFNPWPRMRHLMEERKQTRKFFNKQSSKNTPESVFILYAFCLISLMSVQWNNSLRTRLYYGHFIWYRQNAHIFSIKKSL